MRTSSLLVTRLEEDLRSTLWPQARLLVVQCVWWTPYLISVDSKYLFEQGCDWAFQEAHLADS